MGSMTNAIDALSLEDLTKEVKRTMRRSAKDAVQIGYILRRVMEGRLYLEAYDDFDTYLDRELHMDYSLATRFIRINKKYAKRYVPGGSMELAEEYRNYSAGLLIEMLSMTPEQEARVTPDMTVKQAREIKRQARKPEPVPEQPPAAEAPMSKKEEVIIDGEFREIEEPEKVATSQLEEEASSCDSAAAELGEDLPCEGCVYDDTGGCDYPGTKNDYCVMGDKRIPADLEEDYTGLDFARRILQESQKLLDDYLTAGGLPEETVARQLVITNALAAKVRSLEELDQEATEEDQELTQPKLPILRNVDQRKEWLANYKDWGLWYRDEHIDVNYYKYDFTEGSRLVVAEYPQRSDYWDCRRKEDKHYFYLVEKNKVDFNKCVYEGQYGQDPNNETYIVEFLKRLQKGECNKKDM